jgi:hypothetical protein
MAERSAGVQGLDNEISTDQNPMTKPPAKKTAEMCGNCHYYRYLLCCRFPPTVFNSGPFPSNSRQPMPNPIGWCGEHKPKQINGQ